MLALVDVDFHRGTWQANLLAAPDEWHLQVPATDKLQRWLAPAIEYEAMRGGGVFFATMPD